MLAEAGTIKTSSLLGPIFRSIGLYSVSVLAAKMTGFLLLPVYTRYLTPAEYGAAELLELTLYVFIVLIGMRFGDTLMYYHAAAKTQSERDAVASTIYLGSTILSVGGALMGYFLSPFLSQLVFKDSAYTSYFHYMFAAFALQLPQQVVFSYMRAMDRSGAYLKMSIIQLVMAVGGNMMALVIFRGGLKGLLLSKVVLFFVMGVGLIWYLFASVRLSFDLRLFARTFHYATPLGVGGIGFLIIHFGDRFFLQRYVSLTEIGIYALAYKLGMLVADVFTPFEIYWGARRFELVRGEGGERIFVRVCTYEALLLTFIVVLLALFSRALVTLLAGPAYLSAAQYVPWVAIAYLLRMIGHHFRNVFLLEGKTELDAGIVWIGSLICLAAYATLIPRFALWGAVAATGIAFTAMFFISYWQAQKVRRYPYEYRRMGLIAVAGIVPVFLFALIPAIAPWSRIVTGILLACLYPFSLWLFGFLEVDEYGFLQRTIRRSFGSTG